MITEPTIFADIESAITVFIRVEGKGTFSNSLCLRDFSVKMIEDGRHSFVVDLKNCPSMDSTFMGTLAGITMRLEESGGGGLWVINQNERNKELLSGLGIDLLFSPDPAPEMSTNVAPLAAGPDDKATTREVMREAHEACIKANPANAEKFKDLLEHLAESAKKAT